ncbi:MAG TPA: 5'-methylthioadenosine/S-adenosylhomocysteine nucleosidase [Chthoniobacterales bacterium]
MKSPFYLLDCALALAVLMVVCVPPAQGMEPQTLGVACAFPGELPPLQALLLPDTAKVKSMEVNGTVFHETDMAGKHLVLFMTGMSVVNAAMTTQLAIDRFHLDALVFCGIAGAVDPLLQPGDVVVPEAWIHQAEAVWANRKPGTTDQYILPKIFKSKWGHFGMMWFDDVYVVQPGQTTPRQVHSFPADPQLLAAARGAAAEVRLTRPDGKAAVIKVGGVGMTGPVFLDNRAFREFASRNWGVSVHEMEGTAVAQVGFVNRLPVLVVRGISDLAGGQHGFNQEEEFGRAAARNAAAVTRSIVDQLLSRPEAAATPSSP